VSTYRSAERVQVTPESRYAADWAARLSLVPAIRPLRALGLRPGETVLVVGAHPDDETLGFGASIASLASDRVVVHGLSASSGEAALDHVGHHLDGLGERRAAEYARACRTLGMASSTVQGHRDGGLRQCQDDVQAAVAAMIRRVHPARVLTVWWDDPHPDHRGVGEATVAAARAAGCPVSGFPIWALHWSDPADELSQAQAVHPLLTDAFAEHARRAAMACYGSQTEPLSPDVAAVLPASVLRCTLEGLVRL
jgi:LmbE family N-acetylglucosaminyl deacetylase